MVSRLVRGTAVACGVAAVAGAAIGFALGDPVQPEDILAARSLPADLCERLGDVRSLLPEASKGPVTLTQVGTSTVTCSVQAVSSRRTFASVALNVTVTPYGGRDIGAGKAPLTPPQHAKWTWDRSPLETVANRTYSTKLSGTARGIGGESWSVNALVRRGDIVVHVVYAAGPIERKVAEQAALVLADRAIWETK
ncbi:hypothetical protein E1218_32335 [Kribbella turkmenica]|uniref:DUF3558 domain-containing protein n=1 Tax=Kribbella turkmenica TaxID=2530375 RepID=A0A4R4W857_9ACTN|nr:hypothetical protein [Kribbella turkmenica]TDD14882.1 hypothetical protein E1218_32335 [Kribbella turkmenica]